MVSSPKGLIGFLVGILAFVRLLSVSMAAENTDVILDRVDGQQLTGHWGQIDGNRFELERGGKRTAIALEDVVRITVRERSARPLLAGSVVLLANGDALMARVTGMNDEHILLAWSEYDGWPAVTVPLETVRGIILDVPPTSAARNDLFRRVLDRREASDLLMLKNGDRVSGELLGMGRGSFLLETAAGELKIALDQALGLSMNDELVSFPEIAGLRLQLTLTNGSRLTVRQLHQKSAVALTCQLVTGATLEIPLSAIVRVDCLGGRVVYLSDLEPSDYEFTPYLSTQWMLRRDRSVDGAPLRLRGVEYTRGLGMHSQSRVSYPLDGKYDRFEAVVGIDDETGGAGSVICAVEVDGKRRWTSETLTGASPAVSLPNVDVSQARELTLIVEFGQLGDVQDHVDWCDARLVKAAAD